MGETKWKKKDVNGFIKCDYNEDCFYDNGKETIKKKCGCGYNSEGQGYCPLPNDQRKKNGIKELKI